MSQYGIDVYVMPGNDDPWSCDAVIDAATHVQACDDRVVRVGPHEMISCAYANPHARGTARASSTRTRCTRASSGSPTSSRTPRRAIFNLHVPPYDSGPRHARARSTPT